MIRIKYKTLAVGLLLLLVFLLAVYVELPSKLLEWKRYDAVLKYFPRSSQAPDALYWAAESEAPNPGDGRMFIFHNSSSYSLAGTVSSQGMAYAREKLERLIAEYPGYVLAEQARWKLALIYFAAKEYDRAEPLFRSMADNGKQDGRSKEAAAYAQLLASRRGAEERGAATTPSLQGKVVIGDRPAAGLVVALHRKADSSWMYPPYGRYPMAMTDDAGSFRFYDVPEGEYEAGVGADPAELSGYYLSDLGSETVTIRSGATADYDLRFVPQVKVVQPTNKEVIASGRFEFSWEPYPGAASYKLSIAALEFGEDGKPQGVSSIPLDEAWTEPRAEYDLETLRTYRRGLSKSFSQNEVWIGSSGILGIVYPGGHFVWSVDAFNDRGERISSSRGYYTSLNGSEPFFSVSDKGQLPGDKLVLQGDYKGAIRAYESEGDNPYALRALAIMALDGIEPGDRGDKAKALAYLRRLPNPAPFDLELIRSASERN